MKCLELFALYFQLGIGELTFACQQLQTRVELGDVLTRLLRFLTKDASPTVDQVNLFHVIWLPGLVNFLVILGSQHPFSFNFYFMLT